MGPKTWNLQNAGLYYCEVNQVTGMSPHSLLVIPGLDCIIQIQSHSSCCWLLSGSCPSCLTHQFLSVNSGWLELPGHVAVRDSRTLFLSWKLFCWSKADWPRRIWGTQGLTVLRTFLRTLPPSFPHRALLSSPSLSPIEEKHFSWEERLNRGIYPTSSIAGFYYYWVCELSLHDIYI